MQLISLASGSKGNSYLITTGRTTLLVDAGLSAKQLALRLLEVGSDAAYINAIFITHEHIDHIRGARVFAKKHKIPVFMNQGCFDAARERYLLDEIKDIRLFDTGFPFDFQDVMIHPLSISHDTVDPVCFTINDNKQLFAIVTDLGKMNKLVSTNLRKADALVLESNHDLNMLKNNPNYPENIKQRIRSVHGHLSNTQSAEAARDVIQHGKLKHLMLAHLSENNNTEKQTKKTYLSVFKDAGIDLPFSFAKQHQVGTKFIL
ncbi:MAG: MBL fold metallo-hydrolase [Candidatus Marinimicrobia bacterium]|nr:MBL fold metallo-hydrolase [Candidatus Neomarinimicrobiota bacterium]